jgi:flagellar assembly protein FliH
MPVQENRRLIKAHSVRELESSAPFNLEDLRRQCDAYVGQARSHGTELIAQAAEQADDIRRRAFEEGRTAGKQAGIAAAQNLIESRARELAAEQIRDRLETVLPALDRVIEALDIERERWLTDWEGTAVRLSAIMAEKLVRRELSLHPELTVEVVREALQLAAGRPQITVRLHPLDLAQLEENGPDIVERLSRLGETALTPDESLSRGGCLIETRQGVIDARIETQLSRIVEELLTS